MSSRYAAYVAAALLLAAPSDRINRNLTAAILYAIVGSATLMAPWCSNLFALCFLLALCGCGTALLQIGKFDACLDIKQTTL